MYINVCRACNSPLVNRRRQATTCNAACRAKVWRHARITSLPVTFMLNIANFAFVKNAANAAGKTINEFAHDQTTKGMEIQQC